MIDGYTTRFCDFLKGSAGPAVGALSFRRDIKLRTGVDNIGVDVQGRLWAGCHPKLLTFSKHFADPTRPSPSHFLKITLPPEGPALVEELFLDSGETLSGSSVAAVYRQEMLKRRGSRGSFPSLPVLASVRRFPPEVHSVKQVENLLPS